MIFKFIYYLYLWYFFIITMNVLAIIPARGGSKGIPMKNIRKLAGKPLIQYTIENAKKSTKINKIVVSTDNRKIAQVANSLEVDVPFLRPKKISKDSSLILDTIKHVLKFLETKSSYVPDIIILLQPTSPFRTSKLIDKSITMLTRSKATSILTVSKIRTHPFGSFWITKKYLKPFRYNFTKYYQRQKFPSLYFPTGDVYTFWKTTLEKYDSIYGPRIKPLIINEDNTIDIDNLFDLFLSEMKLLYWNNYRKINSKF